MAMKNSAASPGLLARLTPALLAEGIGTFALIFVGCIAISIGKFAYQDSGLVGIALAHGLVIGVLVSATFAISGGHLNPGVTAGLWAGKKIQTIPAILYIVAQCIGAVLGAVIANLVVPISLGHPSVDGIPLLHASVSQGQGTAIEAISTFFLVFVVYGTLIDKRAHKVGGLFVGLTITLDILWSGPLTGGAVNPARWLGPAIVDGNFANAIVWIAGPIVGGIIAGLLYTQIMDPQKKEALAE